MRITLSTEKLKEMVSRSVKGVGNNKLIPLTSLMCIELKDNTLTLITTDATNYLYIVDEKVVGDDFYVVIDANVFSKLVSKMTSENVSLTIKSDLNYLEIKGNGTYKIELPLDENGEYIKYPNPYYNIDDVESAGVVNRTTIQVILDTIKPAVATTLESGLCYTGYYVGDKVVGTDTLKIASMNVKVFDVPRLISSEMMNLLAVITSEKIEVEVSGDDIVFNTPDCIVVGKLMDGLDDFAIEPIMTLVDTEFESSCSVSKNDLLQLLDRLSLFVGPYDKNVIYLTFTRNGLQVSSKATSGVEIIDYVASKNFTEFTCPIDIQMLCNEVKSIASDVVEIYYGEDNAIKIVDGNITIIVALFEDEDE